MSNFHMLVLVFVGAMLFMSFLWNTSGFLLGQTYDYMNRRRTYHGTKALLSSVALAILYNLPWHSWGLY